MLILLNNERKEMCIVTALFPLCLHDKTTFPNALEMLPTVKLNPHEEVVSKCPRSQRKQVKTLTLGQKLS